MTFAIVLLLTVQPAGVKQVDACDALIPSALRAMVARAHMSYRSPRVSDNLPEDIDWQVKQGGSQCLGVARADYDGDAQSDLAIALTARNGIGARVVVALARGRQWTLRTLATWPEGRQRLYIAAESAGVYRRTAAVDGPLQPGEVNPLRCATNVVVFGQTEASGVAYCFGGGKWPHVWISD